MVEICAFSLLPFTPLTHFVQLRFPSTRLKWKKTAFYQQHAEAETMAETARITVYPRKDTAKTTEMILKQRNAFLMHLT